MTETILQLLAEYGPAVLAWVLTGLGTLLSRYVWVKIQHDFARGVLQRAWDEVNAAVAAVAQSYTDALKERNADGKLTPEEQSEAWAQAMGMVKRNLGSKTFKALVRILGGKDLAEEWIGDRIDAAVKLQKGPKVVTGKSTSADPSSAA